MFLLESGREYAGFEFHFSVLGNHGGHSPSFDIGDGQIVSNIDTEGVESIKFYDLYVAKKLGGLEISTGWRDLSTMFNITDAAQLFINSSFRTTAEWGSTGFRGPGIFPQISYGVHLWAQLSQNLYWGGAVADPLTPENYYSKQLQVHVLLNKKNHTAVTELGYKSEKFHFAMGGWNMEQEALASRARYQQAGYYGMLSGQLGKNLTPFVRYGTATDRPGLIYENRVAGLHLKKVFAKKNEDEFGLGYTTASLKGLKTQEEIYELIYRYNYTARLSFALSSQYIINPFFSNKDGQVMTLRIQIQSRK